MESQFGHSFRDVRVHEGGAADAAARARGAIAYASADQVFFRSGSYRPKAPFGRWLLAHELAHVVQARGGGGQRASSSALEGEADEAASRVAVAASATVRERGGSATPQLLSQVQFKARLGSTPEQAAAVDALFGNATFLGIWDWMRACRVTPRRDLGPLNLNVTPGLRIGGVERFGGFSPGSRTLEINPTKPEHVANPTELVDTVAHELIHAADALRGGCVAAGALPPPMGAAATTTEDTSRANAIATGNEARLNQALGPGASDPCNEFIDINTTAQSTLSDILRSNIQTARVGRPTVTFVNVTIRGNPAAMASYEPCRRAACALPTAAARTRGVEACSRDVIGRFLPPTQLSALLPAVVPFDSGSSVVRSIDREKLDLVGLFLTSHPATTVRLIGRADARGDPALNLALGQRRADSVKAALLARGVAAGQILSTVSLGQTGATASTAATSFQDRVVEITP